MSATKRSLAPWFEDTIPPTCAMFPGEPNLPGHCSPCPSQPGTSAQIAARVCRFSPDLLSWIGMLNLCHGLGIMEGQKDRCLKHPTKTSTRLSFFVSFWCKYLKGLKDLSYSQTDIQTANAKAGHPPHSAPGKYLSWYEEHLLLQYWLCSSSAPA